MHFGSKGLTELRNSGGGKDYYGLRFLVPPEFGSKSKSLSTLMIIPFIMHIDLAVILYIVIFPLAVPKILLGSFWPKIRGKGQFWQFWGKIA